MVKGDTEYKRPHVPDNRPVNTREDVVNIVQELLGTYSGRIRIASGELLLPDLDADPNTAVVGALAVVNGTLKIYDGVGWVIVGVQS